MNHTWVASVGHFTLRAGEALEIVAAFVAQRIEFCGVNEGAGEAGNIVGASADKPIAIRASGIAEFRPWLAMMVKVFRLSDYSLLSLVVEWPRATAHWRVDIYSKVTGVTIPTELVDLVELSEDRILNYTEFFVPR